MINKILNKTMDQKANIEYPTEWTYKIIAHSEENIWAATQACLDDRKRTLTPSRQSAGGRFVSMELSLQVSSEEDRVSIFHRLFKEKGIKLVL